MAGRFEGVSDLEWRLFEDVFPPPTPEAWPWDAACAVSQGIKYVALRLDYRLSVV